MKRDTIVAFAVTRIALVSVALIALALIPTVTGPEYRHVSEQPLVDLWYRWDSGFFTHIARHGYGWLHGQRTADVTFMPLYPLLMSLPLRLIPAATDAEAVIVGVIISNACLLIALFVLDALMRLDHIEVQPRRLAQWLVLISPAAIFLAGVYTESLFILLSLVAVYAARRERWLIAGLAGFLAASTRVMGWTIAVLLIVEAWQQRDRWLLLSLTPRPPLLTTAVSSSGEGTGVRLSSNARRRKPIGRWALSLAPLVALPLYAGVVGLTLHSPTAYFDITRTTWGQGVGAPWQAITDFFNGPITLYGWQRSWIDLAFMLIGLALVMPAYRLRRSYGLYQLAAILFPVISGTLVSMPRYTAIAFPAYIVLAHWASRNRRRAIGLLIGSAILAAFFAARFVTWHWIA